MDASPKTELEPLAHDTEQSMIELRQDISVGLEELKQGKSILGEQVFEELRRLSEAKRR